METVATIEFKSIAKNNFTGGALVDVVVVVVFVVVVVVVVVVEVPSVAARSAIIMPFPGSG